MALYLNTLYISNSHMKKLLLPLLFLLAIPLAAASFLTIQSAITVADNKTIVKTTNLGDETAFNVQLSLEINDKKIVSDVKKQLGIRESFEWEAPLAAKPGIPGKYPLILATNYQDANSYPFSAISVSAFDYTQGTISDIAAKISNIELSGKEKLELAVKNLAETEKQLRIRLIVPKELSADKDSTSLNLPGKSEKALNFEIKKFSALAGSTYAVFAVVEYDEGNKHYTSITSGVVKVVEKNNIFTNQNLLIALLVILVIIFIYFQPLK